MTLLWQRVSESGARKQWRHIHRLHFRVSEDSSNLNDCERGAECLASCRLLNQHPESNGEGHLLTILILKEVLNK